VWQGYAAERRASIPPFFGFHEYGISGRPVKPSSYSPPPFIAPDPADAAVLPGSFLRRVLQFSWEGGLPVPHLSMYLFSMSKYHDRWYTRLFSDPQVVEDLLRSFVHEDFVKLLDFKTLKKLNTKLVPASERSRRADVIFEIKSQGQPAYIYLFLEFQSTVDRFMSMRMARYMFEFYQEIQRLSKARYLNPGFPILIYNGDEKWTAPTRFRELLHPSAIPNKYLPQFSYFKIAINEIPKRDLVKIRNAVAAVFYVENSTPEDIAKNRKELVSLLSSVFRNEGAQLVQTIVERINRTQKIRRSSSTITTINDLTEVSSMWETAVKEHESKVRESATIESERQILSDLLETKFGLTMQNRKRIRGTDSSAKLRRAIKKFAIASSRREVLKCLD